MIGSFVGFTLTQLIPRFEWQWQVRMRHFIPLGLGDRQGYPLSRLSHILVSDTARSVLPCTTSHTVEKGALEFSCTVAAWVGRICWPGNNACQNWYHTDPSARVLQPGSVTQHYTCFHFDCDSCPSTWQHLHVSLWRTGSGLWSSNE